MRLDPIAGGDPSRNSENRNISMAIPPIAGGDPTLAYKTPILDDVSDFLDNTLEKKSYIDAQIDLLIDKANRLLNNQKTPQEQSSSAVNDASDPAQNDSFFEKAIRWIKQPKNLVILGAGIAIISLLRQK